MPSGGLRALLAQGKRSFWLLFGGIWMVAGLILLIVAAGMALQERSWASESVQTTGIVLTKDIVPADSDSSTQYRVRFRFTTQDGKTVEGSQGIDVATWERLTERQPIEVYYLPSSSSARLEAGANLVPLVLFFVFGAVFGGIGTFLFGRSVLGLRRARRLLQSGIETEAIVTGVEQTNVSFNRRPQFRVRYTYRDSTGREHAGDSGYLDWEEASTWKEGERVAILYDPPRPAASLWVGRIDEPTPDSDAAAARIVDAPPPADARPPD